jgi:hypothetical protein
MQAIAEQAIRDVSDSSRQTRRHSWQAVYAFVSRRGWHETDPRFQTFREFRVNLIGEGR